MRTTRRTLVFATTLVTAFAGIVALSPSTFAAVTAPTGNPFVVPGNGAGQPQAFTVSANGFAADSAVFVEQCDGVATTTLGWDPTEHCDLGSSPAAATASASGAVTFSVSDVNHRFTPFKGLSPQGLFNCLGPSDPSPNNGMPDFKNCKIRVSTNNSMATADQSFLNIQLPNSVNAPPGFSGTPAGATKGVPYSFSFTNITGFPTPTFTMSPTTVAGGVHLSTAGVLSGTPTASGTFPITVTAANGVAPNAVKNLSLVVAVGSTAKLECGLAGSLDLKPALSNVVPKRPKPTKVKGTSTLGAAGPCQAGPGAPTGATKYPVTAGSVKAKGSLPTGANCASLPSLPLGGTTLKVKWQGVNPKSGKVTTAGKSLATVSGVTMSGTDTYVVTAHVDTGSFAGLSLTLTLHTDQTHAARASTCQSTSVPSIAFTGLRGLSTLAIS